VQSAFDPTTGSKRDSVFSFEGAFDHDVMIDQVEDCIGPVAMQGTRNRMRHRLSVQPDDRADRPLYDADRRSKAGKIPMKSW